jgi:hypothetical protein
MNSRPKLLKDEDEIQEVKEEPVKMEDMTMLDGALARELAAISDDDRKVKAEQEKSDGALAKALSRTVRSCIRLDHNTSESLAGVPSLASSGRSQQHWQHTYLPRVPLQGGPAGAHGALSEA